MSDNVAAQQSVAGLRHDGMLTEIPSARCPKKTL